MKRRDFLIAGSAFGTSLAAGRETFSETPKEGNHDFTAEEALQQLVDGNRRFVSGKPKHPHMTEDWIKRLTKGQKPFATILACSDSRVPLELLFDQGFGDLFTIRVAGNVVTRYGIGSIEYAQHHLRTPLFMVLGHEGCGAVSATLLPKEQRDKEPKGVRELLDLVEVGSVDPQADARSKLASAVEANVRNSFRQLVEIDPQAEGLHFLPSELTVAAVYEISTGRVRILETYRDKPQ